MYALASAVLPPWLRASNCAVPIVHKAGDVVAETPEVSHWWKNLGDKTVVLLSADLLKDPNDKNM